MQKDHEDTNQTEYVNGVVIIPKYLGLEVSLHSNEFSMNRICRLCMVQGGPSMENIYHEDAEKSIASQIAWVTHLTIQDCDGLPSSICQQCIFQLNLARSFIQRCITTDETLRQLYIEETVVPEISNSCIGNAVTKLEDYIIKAEPMSPCDVQEADQDLETDCSQQSIKIEILEHGMADVNDVEYKHDDHELEAKKRCKGYKTKKKKGASLICETCNKDFPNWDKLRRHMRCHLERRFGCSMCDKLFHRPAQLKRHLRVHTGEKPYACGLCDKTFAARSTLDVHHRTHTGAKEFKCTQCDKSFGHNSTLVTHIRVHEGNKPFKCAHCPIAFAAKGSLTKHARIHNNDRPFKCVRCPLAFTLPGSLRVHNRVHTGERPYRCPHCDKTFAQSNGLGVHMRTHTGDRPYRCQTCFKSYTQRVSLNNHLRSHEGIRPYKCAECGSAFFNKKTLSRHMTAHTGLKKYECHFCDKKFARDTGLASHILLHTKEKPFHCGVCGKHFRQKATLITHKRLHSGERPYKCEFCNMAFTQKGTMITHSRIHTLEKPFSCELCPRTFAQSGNLTSHKKVFHSGSCSKRKETDGRLYSNRKKKLEVLKKSGGGKDNYQCELCSKIFLRKQTLISHVRSMHPCNNVVKVEEMNVDSSNSSIVCIDGAMLSRAHVQRSIKSEIVQN